MRGEVYSTNENAAAVMAGIYSYVNTSGLSAGGKGISIFCGLYCDELELLEGNQEFQRCYENTLTADDSPFWGQLYYCVQHCNLLLEGLHASKTLDAAVKTQLAGEAKFIRAFCYFYLVNFFGDVPLLTTSDIKTNTTTARSDTGKVYQQIVTDLLDAETMLKAAYLAGDARTEVSQRLRPNKWAASALLARIYMYRGNWVAAEEHANKVIAQNSLYKTGAPQDVFLANSKELIWGLENANTTGVNEDAALLFLEHGPDQESQPLFLNEQLLHFFERGDQRMTTWIGKDTTRGSVYYYPKKYHLVENETSRTPYPAILRLSEVFLIRAEAKAYMNDFAGARADLNVLRLRAGLGYSAAMNRAALLTAIEQERRVELFTEWGHRWLDLKRYGRADLVMTALANKKGTTWQSNKLLFPIPHGDILLNHNLVQNKGY
ncbi:RagB/SusD family nutrient uptake outer membrane protein [Chitinophaga sp. S165]|uniref:RagB/SusD family nutrient uptake outer membrane protein n=1 Tax=Chitinophaga sp. S165 TaxID=2135462 RepID=UPI001E408582|nr:RagB/SusD family nutrient uptake outer membrane protein [Chitinophaga sp. S165]